MFDYYGKDCPIADMLGKTFVSVSVNAEKDRMTFVAEDGSEYLFYHQSDCCESVDITDINGDLDFLVGSPLFLAEVATNDKELKPREYAESWTWTFYRFGTHKGYVDVRWLGESNGYNSERVSLVRIKEPTP